MEALNLGDALPLPPHRETMTPRALRQSCGLRQRDVADRLGVTCTTVCDFEIACDRGEFFRWRTLVRYVAALGGTLDVRVRLGDRRIRLKLLPK